MIDHLIVLVAVGPDLLGTIAASDHLVSFLSPLGLRFGSLFLPESSLEQLPCLLSILDRLASCILTSTPVG